jgi:pyruvate/2-oxoglutarate dehydrogenase complex dihydrolipoamide dehydrogenase (E3) component
LDVVVVATGAIPPQSLKWTGEVPQKSAWEILAHGAGDEEKILVVGGGSVGCETAEFLAVRGKKVTIVEILPQMASDLEQHTRTLLLKRLDDMGVSLWPGGELAEVGKGKVLVENKESGEKIDLAVDLIVLACDTQPDRVLYESLKALPCDLHLVGDAFQPRRMAEAVFEGTRVGWRI